MNVKQQRDIFMAKRAKQKRMRRCIAFCTASMNSLSYEMSSLSKSANNVTVCLGEFSSNIITNKKES